MLKCDLSDPLDLCWGDEYVVDALRKLIPFLFRPFSDRLIFKLEKIGGTKTGSQLATLSVIFSSAQVCAKMYDLSDPLDISPARSTRNSQEKKTDVELS